MEKRRVLFVCTHNSARSQMAEAMLNTWSGDRFEAFSAGTEATGIKPETFRVMAEVGISLEGHRSKTIDEFRGQSFDWFVTVCDEAQKNCPVLPGARDRLRDRLHAFMLAAGREDLPDADHVTLP